MTRIKVNGLKCGGCAAKITRVIVAASPDAHVEVDLKAGAVRIDGEHDERTIRLAIARAGYEVVDWMHPE